MAEFIVATDNTEGLREELTLNVLSKTAILLTIASAKESKDIWFLPQEVASKGIDRGEIFYGQAGASNDVEEMLPSLIDTEGRLLILQIDEI